MTCFNLGDVWEYHIRNGKARVYIRETGNLICWTTETNARHLCLIHRALTRLVFGGPGNGACNTSDCGECAMCAARCALSTTARINAAIATVEGAT